MDEFDKLFYSNTAGLIRSLLLGVMSYIIMILFLRISGKRTLSKMNQFDFLVTVALGSALAASILSKNVPLADAAVAFFVLIFLQYIITWASVRFKSFGRIVKSQPVLLLYKGKFLREEMKHQRVTEQEIIAKLRQKGKSDISKIDAIVLETDSSVSIIADIEDIEDENFILKGVKNFPLPLSQQHQITSTK